MEASQKNKTPRYSATQWEAQKTNVERLYIEQDRPLKEVIQILAQEFGFEASEKQLKSRLPKWGFDVKNLKGETMVQLARVKAKRKLENKGSSFRVCKKPVDNQKIDRYLRRHDITDEDLLAMASPVNVASPSYSVFTPRSVRSPTPDVSFNADLTRSSSSGLNFQALSIRDSQPMSPIMESMMDEDFANLFSADSVLNIGENPITNMQHSNSASAVQFEFPTIDEIMNVEVKSEDHLMSEYHRARNAPDTIEEQINPPPTPAAVPANEIEERARRIAQFHGSVVVRYLEKTMQRSRLRNRFADDFQVPMTRQHFCDDYYASDVQQCPTPEHRREEEALGRMGLLCDNCGMELVPDSNSYLGPLCFMCSFVNMWLPLENSESDSSESSF
ncbi:uncharacterized protein PAC_12533 [Phialocephala subalpina]|uniref:Clr5 domain-containing protein n=1 Tax=Phialocephala subalpina TaxID=576137 RepID=A0A1L7XCB1_9HELO|nr:uncharacterized protein PAC_12533 [Phialocephala subalpina]